MKMIQKSVVSTTSGLIQGKYSQDHKSILFAGVPYASPPVGNLRWKAPQPAISWDNVLDCTNFSAWGPQNETTEEYLDPAFTPYGPEFAMSKNDKTSENCLYLNIWTPSENPNHGKLPVLVIIHGGGFYYGSGAVSVLNGENLCKKGIVVITINYRLGIFGFLAHPELSAESPDGVSGNYAILDQIAALKWVRDNISGFGGDRDRVTVAGESGGAMSVCILYESPLARGLFNGAIAQSGALMDERGYAPGISLWQAEVIGLDLARNLKAPTVSQLRALTPAQLLQAPEILSPIRDGVIWPSDSEGIYANHKQADVPLMMGSNSDEGSIFHTYFPDSETFIKNAQEKYGQAAERFLEIYPVGEKWQAYHSMCRETGDRLFGYQMRLWAERQQSTGKAKIFLYHFNRVTPGSNFGAFHTSELVYFYQNLHVTKAAWTDEDMRLSRTMSDYLFNFICNGFPSSENAPEWKDYSSSPWEVMGLGLYVGMIPEPNKAAMEFFANHK